MMYAGKNMGNTDNGYNDDENNDMDNGMDNNDHILVTPPGDNVHDEQKQEDSYDNMYEKPVNQTKKGDT